MARGTPIDALIEAKLAEIGNLERALEKLRIELGALEVARAAVTGKPPPQRPAAGFAENGSTFKVDHEKRRGRSISDNWKRILETIGKKGEGGAPLDEIMALCAQEGVQLQRGTLRAQMANYVKRGYLGRTGEGKFFLTVSGIKVAGLNQQIPAQAGNEAGHPR